MGKPDVGVREAHSVGHLLAIDAVATSSATAVAVITKAQMATAGRNAINTISLQVSGAGDSWLIPNVKNTDTLASDANKSQKNVVVTNVDRYEVDDWILLYENDYATHEFGKIASINTTTDTLTLYSNLVNDFAMADSAAILVIEPWANSNQYIKLKSGYDFSELGLAWKSLYLRRMSATNITVDGYVGVV